MTYLEKWQEYWQDKTTPLHRYSTPEHYASYGAELKILFANIQPNNVLEIGCGNGALYNYLGFENTNYKGIDFSSSMLHVFQKNYPDLDLECCDGSTYVDENKYDLIFSNGVIQNFDKTMLDKHFANAVKMMNKNSYFVCASIPSRSQRFRYISGELVTGKQPNILRAYGKYVLRSFKEDTMGNWYNFKEIIDLANKNNMLVSFYGSMHYLYRFHAVMKLNESHG